MGKKIAPKTWVFVIIVNPGGSEKILGQFDHKNNISFIPIFQTRAAAEKGINLLSKEIKNSHEIHAIIYEDILKYAHDEKFIVFVLDENGEIKSKISP